MGSERPCVGFDLARESVAAYRAWHDVRFAFEQEVPGAHQKSAIQLDRSIRHSRPKMDRSACAPRRPPARPARLRNERTNVAQAALPKTSVAA
jgi:hypothetical protein